jgi:hypothetical protein
LLGCMFLLIQGWDWGFRFVSLRSVFFFKFRPLIIWPSPFLAMES